MASDAPPSVQVVDGAGNFNTAGLDSFVRTVKLAECGLSYAVIAIMGPQSSGKSTLLNHLFKTRFVEMDAFTGRSQTTQGIWMARAENIEPCTLICDLEGSDSRERGEDDTAFEKQSSLFALALADVVLVNMWCHDIGREQAANKPLLKTVFQVMMRLFTPRKTTLLFVVRDKTKTPMERLEPILREDVKKIWETVTKPQQYAMTPLSEFFKIEVTGLSSFEEKEEQFNQEVKELRERFQNSIAPGRIAGDRRGVVPGTGFPISTQEIWRVIKENKDLDLPAHKVMVATVRCEEIVQEKVDELASSEAWRALDEGSRSGVVTGFGKQASAILHQSFAGYDAEAAYFDEGVRLSKRQFMLARIRELLQPAYLAALGHRRAAALDKLKAELESSTGGKEGSAASFAATARDLVERALAQFDAGTEDANVPEMEWDASKMREKLKRDMDAHVAAVKAEKLQAVCSDAEKFLVSALADPVSSLLDAATPRTWSQIRAVFAKETSRGKQDLAAALGGYELEDKEVEKALEGLVGTGRVAIEKRTREEAGQALMHMKDRFNTVFSRDADSMPRRWTGREDLRAITRDARTAALQLLSVLAAVRLDSEVEDSVEATLLGLLGDTEGGASSAASAAADDAAMPETQINGSVAASSWAKLSPSDTILTPMQCRGLWRQFKSETEYTIGQAMQAQEASRRSNSWLPPPWAILAMVVLGFNEAMALVRNPLLLLALVVTYFVSRALWVQLDAGAEFSNGLLPGILAISAKFMPTIMNMLKRLIEEGEKMHQQRNHHPHYNGHTRTPPRKEVQMQDFVSEKNGGPSASHGVTEDSIRHRTTKMAPAF